MPERDCNGRCLSCYVPKLHTHQYGQNQSNPKNAVTHPSFAPDARRSRPPSISVQEPAPERSDREAPRPRPLKPSPAWSLYLPVVSANDLNRRPYCQLHTGSSSQAEQGRNKPLASQNSRICPVLPGTAAYPTAAQIFEGHEADEEDAVRGRP